MRDFSSPASLAGSLLLAHPSLLDPNFRRSAVILSAHDPEEGSFGLILNRALAKTVSDFLPTHSLGPLGKTPVFLGGPVATDQILFASLAWDEEADSVACRTNLSVEQAQACAEEGEPVRAFVGYSGWSGQQLETELSQGGWIVRPSTRAVLDAERCGELWRDTMRGLGPWFRLMAAAPDDPSKN